MMVRWTATLAACSLLVAGCSGGEAAPPSAGFVPAASLASGSVPIGKYIKHVVVIIQENRTFDNVFDGFPNADTQPYGYDSAGKKVVLQQIPFVVTTFGQDMIHNFNEAVTAWDSGKMDRFDRTPFDNGSPAGSFAYSYLEPAQVAPYWTLAKQYAIADHFFPMEFGPSFTSHLALIAGTDNLNAGNDLAEANYPEGEPWGCDQGFAGATWTVNSKRLVQLDGPEPCFTTFKTMADSLDAKGASWRYYAPPISANDGGQLWTSFDAIKAVRYGPDWKNVVTPQTRILRDAKAGKLAAMSWVIPDWQDSDHPAANSDTGPSWVASVVNAIGKGPDWNSTAIFLLWDDWGGWYDNVPPPQKDFRGLGIRVPLVIISPYVRAGYVDHRQYESASVLKFAEEAFGLPPIGPAAQGYTDTRAAAPLDAFDFTQKPRAFVPISAKYPASHFLHERPSYHVVDEE